MNEKEKKKKFRVSAVGVVEIVLILVVLIALVLIFKDNITSLVTNAFDKINSNAGKIIK
ncbi:MAG: hypothetical protein IKS11_03750 [Lachnospiraceae bacterium]|jgi:hypothetical protein|nr:hypothetical protein [Lachnospiraceae bacterium]MBR6358743.1 hypothetical protein [Lachnospiraceae bacterium]